MNLSSSGDMIGMAIASPRKVADEVERELCESVGDVLQSKRQLLSFGRSLWPSGAAKIDQLTKSVAGARRHPCLAFRRPTSGI
jgi:hypothetical protein